MENKEWKCVVCDHFNTSDTCEECGNDRLWNDGYKKRKILTCIVVTVSLGGGYGLAIIAAKFNAPDFVIFLLFIVGAFLTEIIILLSLFRKIPRNFEVEYENRKKNYNQNCQELKAHFKKVEMVCECGKIYPEGTKFCAIDGKPLTRRVVDNFIWQCPTCKKTYAEGGYCPSDGKKLERVPQK